MKNCLNQDLQDYRMNRMKNCLNQDLQDYRMNRMKIKGKTRPYNCSICVHLRPSASICGSHFLQRLQKPLQRIGLIKYLIITQDPLFIHQ